jgi:hypothetical protein
VQVHHQHEAESQWRVFASEWLWRVLSICYMPQQQCFSNSALQNRCLLPNPATAAHASCREAYAALKLCCWINLLEKRLFSAP